MYESSRQMKYLGHKRWHKWLMAQAAAGAVSALGPASPGVDAVHHASENGIERGHLEQACKENDCCVANKDEQQQKPSSKLSFTRSNTATIGENPRTKELHFLEKINQLLEKTFKKSVKVSNYSAWVIKRLVGFYLLDEEK